MGKSTTTTTEQKTVDPVAQGTINDITGEARRLYQSGAGTSLWSGPLIAPLNPVMAEGLSGLINTARRNAGGTSAFKLPTAPQAPRTPQVAGPVGDFRDTRPPKERNNGGVRGDFGPGGNVIADPAPTPQAPGVPQSFAPSTDYAQFAPTGGFAADDGSGGFGTASMPWLYGLDQIAANGLTADMRAPLRTLQNVASGRDAVTTGGIYGGLLGRSLTQNNLPNDVMAGLAAGNPITTAGAYGDVARRARNANRDIVASAGNVAGGNRNIAAGGELLDLYNASRGQNADAQGALAGVGDTLGRFSDQALTQNAPARSVLGRVAQGADAIATGDQYRGVSDNAMLPTASAEYLSDLARGGGVNPFLRQMLDDQAARITNRVNSSMSGAGRFGSAGHADALAKSITEFENPLLAQAYESDQNRRLSAATQIDAARRAADATRIAGIAGETGVQGQNISNAADAASRLAGMRQADLGLAGNLATSRAGVANNLAASRNADTSLGAGLLGQVGGFANQDIANELNAAGLIGQLRNAGFNSEIGALSGMTGAQGQNAATRLNAATGLSGSQRADVTNALAAAGGLTGTQQQNIANRTGAAGGLLDAYGQGANRAINWAQLAPALNALTYDPTQRLMAAGGLLQGRDDAGLAAQRALFDQANLMPWTQLGRYSAATNPLTLGLLSHATNSTKTSETPFTIMDYLKLFAGGDRSAASGVADAGSEILGKLFPGG